MSAGRRPPRRVPALIALAVLAACISAPAATAAARQPVPEPGTGVTGTPSSGTTPGGEVRGYIDGHTHLMSYEAFGGRLMCGRPFDPGGIEKALRDCPDHAGNGSFAWFENLMRHGTPLGTHDPVGWPTFRDWPAWDSRTHQQAYYLWLKRSWQAGQRILVNHLVANRQLCEVYPLKRNPCDEMEIVRLQARRMTQLQAYIDERNGGPGRGWFRIVRDSREARKVIEAGKLAVVLGVEVSEPFGCRLAGDGSLCTRGDIDRGLDEMKSLGVSSMFLCHKFDNALCGVRFDGGATGAVVNAGNLLGTGNFWKVEECTGPAHDNTIEGLYPPGPHCNARGLTELGEYALKGLVERNMLVEIDHMSVKAADRALDLLERLGYSGVVSSHNWVDPHYIGRVYGLGGMVTAYGTDASTFVEIWKRNRKDRDPRYAYGYGYGLDANGMGPLPPPREEGQAGPVRYPFTSPVDPNVTLHRQRTGERTWDVNVDGVANYGLVPDWIADLRALGGPRLIADLARGAEAYLQMWHRADTHGRARR